MPDALGEVPVLPFWDQLPEARRQRLIFLLARLVRRQLKTQAEKEGFHE